VRKQTKEGIKMILTQTNIGFIGFGNMGQAMAKGWVEQGEINPKNIYAAARDFKKLKQNCKKLGIQPCENSETLVSQADIIILAVKPHQIASVIEPLKEILHNKIILSVAAGYTFEMFEEILLKGTSHVSTIPNTPVSIGEGITIVEETHSLADEEYKMVSDLLNKLGLVQIVETDQLSTAGTLAGCGPAFASLFIEVLADGAVKYGLSRQAAYQLASQMLAGTGKMQLETKEHPGVMKDQVTSPGGTTIKGVAALEKNNFRHAVIEAFDAIEGE